MTEPSARPPAIIGYVRVSTLVQATEGYGLDTQAEQIRAWCNYQRLPEPTIESDPGVSGTNLQRPGFKRAMHAVLNGGPGSILIVYKLDRLGRDAIAIQEIIEVCLAEKIRVVSLSEGIDSGSGALAGAILKLMIGILASVADLERETILSRMADGRAQAKSSGRSYCRIPPYGWQKDGKGNLVENDYELEALQRMKRMRAEGKTFQAIARALEASGVFSREGRPWTTTTIRRLTVVRSKPGNRPNARLERVRRENASDVT